MFLEVTKIESFKQSQKEGVYEMVKMKDIDTGKYYFTYICPMYRNYRKWKRIARLGNQIYFMNLKMKGDNLISADSSPLLLSGRKINKIELPKTSEEWLKAGYI